MKKLFLFLTTVTLMFSSCKQDMELYTYPPLYLVPTYIVPGTTNAQGQSAIAFTTYSNGQGTRAFVNSESTTGYDDFSLYTWTNDSVVMDGYHTKWVTNGWTYVGVDGQQIKYFDNFVDEYNFIGVIPQQINNSISNGKVTLETEGFFVDNEATTDTPKEFLYATATVQKSNYPTGVTMNFKHGNAKVYLKFTSNDANTKIIDYSPYTPGQAAHAAWDEEVITYSYNVTCKPFPAQGPRFNESAITQEDIDYVNSKYSVNGNWATYYSSNVTVSGPLDEDMWQYLTNKYPTLQTEDLKQWSSQVANQNMKLVHMEIINGSGDSSLDGCIRGWFVNVLNMSNTPTEVVTTVHHDAVQGIPESGKEGVVILPATSTLGNGSDAVLATYPTKATTEISLNGLSWNVTETTNIATFTKPSAKITSNDASTAIASPTTWYALPCNDANVGYTIKISYTYKGVNVYDARVFIPANECEWSEGKYYTYVIQLNGKGNGKPTPTDINAEDPTVNTSDNNEIKLFKVEFSEYGDGGTIIKEIK